MAIDRDTTLRKAEKFLRQGRLDAAIAEYARIVEDYPRDWKTVTLLGDLHVRAGHVESACAQYARIAEHLAGEGFLSKAAAVYKKIVKIKPDDENALIKSAAIFEEQGLVADARLALSNLLERRRRRGDKRGTTEIVARLGRLDGGDLGSRLSGARAALELGDTADAIARFKDVAAAFIEKGKADEGRAALAEAARLDPTDTETRAALWQVYIDAGAIDEAREFASTAAHFKALAVELAARGREDEALATLARVLESEPGDIETRARLARSYVARGDLDRARACLKGESIGDVAELQLVAIEIELRTGRLDQARSLMQALVASDPARRDDLVLLGCGLSDANPAAAFQCVDAATDAAVGDADWPAAASALHEFVTRVPNHIPALMKLVEIRVDGGLEATMYSAQAQLADAYLAADQPAEARVIAEDPVAREPWERSNIERFRRALSMMGEADPDAVIAERLSGDSPFTSTDLGLDLEFDDSTQKAADEAPVEEVVLVADEAEDEAPDSTLEILPVEEAIDLAAPPADEAGFEIDLSDALGDLSEAASAASAESGAPLAPEPDLEAVFEGFRSEQGDAGAQHFSLATTYEEMGMAEQSMKELELAARSPKYRFEASARLGRAARQAGRLHEAVEWFERAAEAPASDVASGRALLYDLGLTLAEAGEAVRALAVFLELHADVPGFRDVAAQVDWLRQSLQA